MATVMYRLLALDIDDTLLKSNQRLTKETKEAIEYVKDKGVYVTLATGRSFPSAKKVANALRLTDAYLITHDGAYIGKDVNEPIFERRLDADEVYKIVDILENYYCHIKLLHEKYAIGNKTKQKNIRVRMRLGAGDPLFYPMNYVESLSHHLIDQPLTVPKIQAYFWHEREKLDAIEELNEAVPQVRLTSSKDGIIDMTHGAVSKGRALQVLGRKLGISLQEMVAIGAYDNDLEMITEAGIGIAMGQAPEKIKRAANWITRSNNQNGVAYAVKEIFRKQLHPEVFKY